MCIASRITPFLILFLSSASWHSSTTPTEDFPCIILSCKANARVKPAKTVHGPQSSKLFVFFYVFFVLCRSAYCVCVCVCVCVCKCVLYYCHRVATQLQLTNISYHFISYHVVYSVIYHRKRSANMTDRSTNFPYI